MKVTTRVKKPESFAAGVGRVLRMAAKAARKTARMYGTPIYGIELGYVPGPRIVPATYAIGATGGHCDYTEFPPSINTPTTQSLMVRRSYVPWCASYANTARKSSSSVVLVACFPRQIPPAGSNIA